MSDDEIRNLLDLGVDDPAPGPAPDGSAPGARQLSAQELWDAGRRRRNRGRAWVGGLGAAAAAAGILGIVWGQGLVGGDTAPEPPADSTTDALPGPDAHSARGAPFLAVFHRTGAEAPRELSGASVPATLDALQGTWHGPTGERLVVDGDTLILTITTCEWVRASVTVSDTGRLTAPEWNTTMADGPDCAAPVPEQVPWTAAIMAEPLVSVDGDVLLISGLDGTTEDPRVHVALTLGPLGDNGFTWADVPSRTGVTPISLGPDVALTTGGGSDGVGMDSIHELQLEDRPGAANAAQHEDVEPLGYPSTCPLRLASSLRSDGVLLAGAPEPFSACAEGTDAYLPPVEPSPAVVALLRSGPTVGFDGDTMVISGTIPESLLEATSPPGDPASTTGTPTGSADSTDDQTGTEAPTYRDDIPLVLGVPTLVVMSEGEWAPTGELTTLTQEAATGRRWLPVATDSDPPEVGADPSGERGLSFDGTTWRIRDCGVDIRVRGGLQDGLLTTHGEPEVVPDPDPGAACVFPLTPEEWEAVLTGETYLATDGDVLIIRARLGGVQLEPVGMALLPEGAEEPRGGEMPPVERETLGDGLVELPPHLAAEMNVPGVRDAQPDHDTRLSLSDSEVTVDVGCAEPLTGPAWYSEVGSDPPQRSLTAVLATASDCPGAAADDAELWRQMLAQGVFLHHYGDYVILDSWADPALAPVILP